MKRLYNLNPILHINDEEAFELSSLTVSDFKCGVDEFSAVSLLEAAKILQNATSNTVIITKGKDGSCCLEAGKDNLTEVDGIKTDCCRYNWCRRQSYWSDHGQSRKWLLLGRGTLTGE